MLLTCDVWIREDVIVEVIDCYYYLLVLVSAVGILGSFVRIPDFVRPYKFYLTKLHVAYC